MNGSLLRIALICIAAITVLTGLVQLAAPGWALAFISADHSPLGAHFFRTVGMFMVITGAMFLQSLCARSAEGFIPFWIGVQKLAAALLVGWAIVSGLLAPIAYAVAGFDAATAILTFAFWRRLPQ
jgi:hypothetical protein